MDEVFLEVNDYLDLYLIAKSLKDEDWQKQILRKLNDFPEENVHRDIELTVEKLWKEYRVINITILDLYKQLRNESSNTQLHEKISELEHKRIFLSKKIQLEEDKLHHLSK